ncbi:MAG: oxidoreductase, partial [Bacteroidales bacterium]|nr:oxidoreductase [Bacteroidales bacterium]
ITSQGFEELKECFDLADKTGVLLYDIMTERNEITSILQKELAHIEPIYGIQKEGTAEEPGIEMESVHNFFKMVAGSPLTRPAWFYDLDRQGEAIVDVATHLVDLVQWQLFPEQIINCSDINMISARHWPTPMTPEQFKLSTGLDSYPDFLAGSVKDGVLQVCTNGEMLYSIKGVTARVVALWNFESPNYADTHYCLMRGTKSNLVIRQGEAQGYRPELYIEALDASAEYALKMSEAFASLADKYPGIQLETKDNGIWHVMIPDSYRVGHEAHFGQVTEHFLQYLEDGKLPDWEKPCMISKYYTTTKALEMARQAE